MLVICMDLICRKMGVCVGRVMLAVCVGGMSCRGWMGIVRLCVGMGWCCWMSSVMITILMMVMGVLMHVQYSQCISA